MAWAKVDDQWFAHRKVVALSLGARGLWITVLSWTCAHKTAFIPQHMPRFLAGQDLGSIPGELEQAGLWHGPDHGCDVCPDIEAGWVIHNWPEYQDRSLSEKRSDAGKKGAAKRWGTAPEMANDGKPDGNSGLPSTANAMAGAHPDPSLPNPTQEQDPPSTDVDSPDFNDDFWERYPKRDGKRIGKKQAKQQWSKLKPDDRRLAVTAVENYAAAAEDPKVFCPVKDPWRWLRDRLFDDWQEPAQPSANGPPQLSNVRQLSAAEAGRF